MRVSEIQADRTYSGPQNVYHARVWLVFGGTVYYAAHKSNRVRPQFMSRCDVSLFSKWARKEVAN
jgi:hypothetical protein